MGVKEVFTESTLAKYGRMIRVTPPEVIYNRHMLLSTALYATASMPLTWDQGSTSSVPSLPGFQQYFGFTSSNAATVRYFVSLVYIGAGIGALLSYFINDRVGRLWSWRIYQAIWIIGQLIATFAPNVGALYAARIISGFGIGALTVIGTMAIAEIAPTEIRGLLAVWFSVAMTISLVCAVFCVYGVFLHIPASRLQYQTVWFSPCVFLGLLIMASFFLSESPRWLFLVGRNEEAVKVLVRLRGLPATHPRVAMELEQIRDSTHQQTTGYQHGYTNLISIMKETFLVPANLRRVQQTLLSYALAQLSGANSVTSYFVPILKLMGVGGDTSRSIFLTGMYCLSKLFFTVIASFFFIDALGRRRSVMVGACLQMLSDLYLGIYIKYKQAGLANDASATGALIAMFIHAFGYAVGLFIVPYVFGAEVWPNRIRSFGGAVSQCFHWLFFYAVSAALPSLLSSLDNWGAFIFFAAWCFIAIGYVFFMVPETAGLSVEEIDETFKGAWFNAYKRDQKPRGTTLDGENIEELVKEASATSISKTNAGGTRIDDEKVSMVAMRG